MRGPHKPDGIMHVNVTVVDDHDEAVKDDKGQIKTAKADEKAQFEEWYRRPMVPVYTGPFTFPPLVLPDAALPPPCMPVAEADTPYAADWWHVGPVAKAHETSHTVGDPWSHLR